MADFGALPAGGRAASRLRAGDRGARRGEHLRHRRGSRRSSAMRRPSAPARVVAIGNGVDSEYFSPSHGFRVAVRARRAPDRLHRRDGLLAERRCGDRGSPARCCRRSEGAMPSARFYVVGMNPDAAVRALASDPAVVVTGRVDDVRPYLQHARVVVAPLRVARGIQNKVLEAMAMAKPVVVTPPMAAAHVGAARASSSRSRPMRAEFAAKVLALMDPERAQPDGRRRPRARPRAITPGRRATRGSTSCSSATARLRGLRRALRRAASTARWRRVERPMKLETERHARARTSRRLPSAIGGARRGGSPCRWSSWRVVAILAIYWRRPNRSSRSGGARRHSRTAF